MKSKENLIIFFKYLLRFLMHTLPKSAFCPRLLQASAAPRPENSHSDEKDALFGLNTQMTI
jgi:hypothetical protein